MKRLISEGLAILFIFYTLSFFIGSNIATSEYDPAQAKALVEKKCTTCHKLGEKPGGEKIKMNRTFAEWQETVKKMKTFGAQYTDEEAKIIIQYLAEVYKVEKIGVELTQWDIALIVFGVILAILGLAYIARV